MHYVAGGGVGWHVGSVERGGGWHVSEGVAHQLAKGFDFGPYLVDGQREGGGSQTTEITHICMPHTPTFDAEILVAKRCALYIFLGNYGKCKELNTKTLTSRLCGTQARMF